MSKHSTNKLIKEIESLPVDERIRVADSILKTLNPVDKEIEEKWIEVAENRLLELKKGETHPVPGDEVFDRINKRYSE